MSLKKKRKTCIASELNWKKYSVVCMKRKSIVTDLRFEMNLFDGCCCYFLRNIFELMQWKSLFNQLSWQQIEFHRKIISFDPRFVWKFHRNSMWWNILENKYIQNPLHISQIFEYKHGQRRRQHEIRGFRWFNKKYVIKNNAKAKDQES